MAWYPCKRMWTALTYWTRYRGKSSFITRYPVQIGLSSTNTKAVHISTSDESSCPRSTQSCSTFLLLNLRYRLALGHTNWQSTRRNSSQVPRCSVGRGWCPLKGEARPCPKVSSCRQFRQHSCYHVRLDQPTRWSWCLGTLVSVSTCIP
jgi:hypothetical protein